MAQSAISAAVCSAKPAAIDHSATRCSERRLLTNANTEWIAAIRYAVRTASSKDRIGGVKSPYQGTALVASLVDELTASKAGHIRHSWKTVLVGWANVMLFGNIVTPNPLSLSGFFAVTNLRIVA